MADRCPHLDYRTGDGDREFGTARAYCTVADRFVRPVRADVCRARYDLDPGTHCEIYREHEGIEDPWLTGDGDGDGSGNGNGNGDERGRTNRDGDGGDRG
jgi:hypothetical protein